MHDFLLCKSKNNRVADKKSKDFTYLCTGFIDTDYRSFFVKIIRSRFWDIAIYDTCASKNYDNTAFSLKEDFKHITFHLSRNLFRNVVLAG